MRSKNKTILIIGGGASGAAAAWNLSKSLNLKVICLEQGTKRIQLFKWWVGVK